MNTLLCLDEQSVASADGVTFHLNPAVKHPTNPVLFPGAPHEWDSLQVTWPGTVLYDAEQRLFHCWYSGLNAVQSERPTFPWEFGYAQSDDGVHWRKPDLGQSPYRGRPTNRLAIDFDGWQLSFVALNPDRTDRARRFLSYWKESNPVGAKALASSPDGVVWRREVTAYREAPGRSQMTDLSQLLFVPDHPDPDFRVLGFSQYWTPRTWDGRLVRQIGLHHGPDARLLHDAANPLLLSPEQGLDEELHFAAVLRVGQHYVMLFESDRFSAQPLHGDLRLAVSADARSFRRVHRATPLVPTGGPGLWDENMLVTTTSAMQEVGDEVYIFYFGVPRVYTSWPGDYAVSPDLKGSLFYPAALGLAKLPRDRFGYATGTGTVTTPPAVHAADGVWINADGDNVRLALLDEGDRVVAHGDLSDERRQTVYRKVRWARPIADGLYRLRATLTGSTKLYSLRW